MEMLQGVSQPFSELFVGHALHDVLPTVDEAQFLPGVMRSMTYEIGPFRETSKNLCPNRCKGVATMLGFFAGHPPVIIGIPAKES